jgi:hypothetical protein
MAAWLLLAAWTAASASAPSVDAPLAGAAGAFAAAEADPPSGAASADSLGGRPIARVEVHARNIFDPVPPGRLAPLFSLANRLHFRTREMTVRAQLLMQPGDAWSQARSHETARKLRALNFLVPSRIDAEPDADSVVVQVETRDVWSTNPEFNVESAGGRQFGSIGFTERNLLGLGKSFSVSYRDLPSGRSRAILFSDPSLQGSRVQVHYGASDGASGASDELEIGQPFYAEDARHTYGFSWDRTTSVASVYQRAAEIANFNRRQDVWGVYWGAGRRRDGTVQRVVYSFESSGRRFGPTQALETGVPPEYLGGEESLRLRRFSVEGSLWQPNFIERVRVNGFGLIEDFDVGSSVGLSIGFSPKLLGSFQDEAFGRGRFTSGILTPLGFGQLSASASSRFLTLPLETIGQVDARWVQQSRFGQTLVLAARGIAGRNVVRDFQAIAGGLNGLRAYPVTAVAGRRLWRLNAESRWIAGNRFWEGVTLGGVLFTDAARAWGPGAAGSEWFVSAGTGLRVSLPQWSLGQVLRIDLAWPLEPTRDAKRQPQVSFGSGQAF